MKILIVNTSDSVGGAAIAANRLMKALKSEGADVSMLVFNRKSDSPQVQEIDGKWKKRFTFLFERLVIWVRNHFSRKNLFAVSIANTGFDITRLRIFREADVIHLHWINQGFLSVDNLRKVMQSGKKVVWTMHDMWAFTGICHYSNDCQKYQTACGFCPQLLTPSQHDLSSSVFAEKQKAYKTPFSVVGCSKWIADCARKSQLFTNQYICSIPNPIDTDVFKPLQKQPLRAKHHLPSDKVLFLFSAQKVTDPRKGMNYLLDACRLIARNNPQVASQIGLVILGGKAASAGNQWQELSSSFSLTFINYINSETEMAEVYNAADAFVTPSLQDNLPNTILESLSCGLPCIGFNTGGIPEMIDHQKDGYVARYQSSSDLAEGMIWLVNHPDRKSLCDYARQKVLSTYSPHVVASQMLELYSR